MNQESQSGQPALPFSEACERNKQPILEVLKIELADLANSSQVLEIGSGTGQHAVYFAEQLPHLHWQASDTGGYLSGLKARVKYAALPNLAPPLELDVRMRAWPIVAAKAIFSANTVHFMSLSCAEDLFSGIGRTLLPGGRLLIYGPFRYAGAFTSESNAQFDRWLKETDPERGVRDFEWVNSLAEAQGLTLMSDTPMPANNQLLIWQAAAGA